MNNSVSWIGIYRENWIIVYIIDACTYKSSHDITYSYFINKTVKLDVRPTGKSTDINRIGISFGNV